MALALRVISEMMAPRGIVLSIGATVIVRASLLALGIATTVLVARQLGPSGRGEYAVAVALTGIGIQLANLGVHTSSSWAVARFPNLLGSLLANGLIVAAVLGTGTAVIAWVVLGVLPEAPALTTTLLAVALVAIPIGLAYLIGQNLLLGLQHIRLYNAIELGNRTLAFAGVALFAVAGILTPVLAVAATALALAVATVATLGALYREAEHAVQPRLPLIRDFSGYGLRAYSAALFTFLVLRLDILLVERLESSAGAGQYSIAVSIAEVVTLPAVVAATILFPRLSGMADEPHRRQLTVRSAVIAGAVTVLAAGMVGVVVQPVIEVVFGPEFLPAVEPAVWLLPGAVAFAVHSILVSYYYSIGTPAVTIFAPLLGLVANVSLDLLLIPAHGIVGAAIGSTLSYGLMLALTIVSFSRLRT